ncbi:MAG: hypothetical protein P1V97_10345, partial [Planctomycetota bacterium]|nr:hypothetical protein [Planctomycetota bacterium]
VLSTSSRKEEMSLRLLVENSSQNSAQFCTYHTPFEGIRNNIFEVRDAQGNEQQYQGKMAKRIPPGKNDFVVLKAGASKSVDFNLEDAYQFPPGDYTIQFQGSDISMLPSSNSVSLKLS